MSELSAAFVIAIAVGLAMDAFAVSISCSTAIRKISPRQVFRLAFHFGLFQAGMPVVGWFLGSQARFLIESWDHWVAFGLLAFVGGRAICQAIGPCSEEAGPKDPTKGWSLVLFSVATSIDALAVGLSLAMLNVSIWQPALAIGVITATLTMLGMLIGSKVGDRFGKSVEVLGGLVLISIGVKVLIDHLWV